MRIKKQYKYILSAIFASAFLFCTCLLAQASYVQKERIPGAEPTSDFIAYLGNLYTFGISVAAILAIFMIAFGAFVYIVTSAGNASKMADAKEMIFDAIYGLIIALVAYLILFVVNPDLVSGTIDQVRKAPDFLNSSYRRSPPSSSQPSPDITPPVDIPF